MEDFKATRHGVETIKKIRECELCRLEPFNLYFVLFYRQEGIIALKHCYSFASSIKVILVHEYLFFMHQLLCI